MKVNARMETEGGARVMTEVVKVMRLVVMKGVNCSGIMDVKLMDRIAPSRKAKVAGKMQTIV